MRWRGRRALRTIFYDGPVYKNNDPNTLLVSPGRSGIGKFEGAPSVMHTENLRKDLTGRTVAIPQYMQEYGLKPVPAGPTKLRFKRHPVRCWGGARA